MKKTTFSFFLLFQLLLSHSQESMEYYLPGDVAYNEDIPTPEQFYKQELGEWHLTHGQVLDYLKEIARISDRAIMYEYARSYENKPLVHMVFTSVENQANLEDLKELHLQYSSPDARIPVDGVPLVVALTYGVHGNESSATNSSVLTAYYLAAAEGGKIDKLLGSTIILVDPCLNPDGFTRHSTWANMHQSATFSTDNNSRQFREGWPGGRTNHYWFDLNRDYLLLVNPETRGRVAKFHEWKPNVLTDHHESSANFSFFFQPGVPDRINPLTPEKNYELTSEIALYHAQFLDEIGSQYFSEEVFDDYYFGKGSTYPDINGGVGILFEAAAIRGRVRETTNGVKKMSLGIKNHFTVSLSSLEASVNLREELLNYQRDFYREALELGAKNEVQAYVFGSKTDRIKTRRFVEFLTAHQIEVYKNEKEENSFVVPVKQKQFRLLTSFFEEVTSFRDTAFYDVSTWTMVHAFDVPFVRLKSMKDVQISGKTVTLEDLEAGVKGSKSSIAYLFRWNEYSTPQVLYLLQNAGLITKVATRASSFRIDNREEDFTHGTILVPVNQQEINEDQIFELVSEIAMKTGIEFYGLSTGRSSTGVDIGSSSFVALTKPEILMFIGGGANAYMAGEIWHLFDQDYRIPMTLAQTDRLGSIELGKYNSLILPGGSYTEWSENDVQKLKSWIEKGGILIAYAEASRWAARNDLGKTQFKESVQPDTTRYLQYDERIKERNLHVIGGAIFKALLDLSHPLCYGYLREDLALMKKGTLVAIPSGVKYSEPVKFAREPYISGWVSDENLNRISGAPVLTVQTIGRGKLISYHEDMNFRGNWLGTNKLLANSIFFGSMIR
jgi:hypothetical protein